MNSETSDMWEEWGRHYADSPVPGIRSLASQIIRDGIVSADFSDYFNTKPRILYVLKECNQYPENENGDLCEYLRTKLLHGQLARNIARWTGSVRYPSLDVDDINGRPSLLADALRSVAIVNLKKIAGGPIADNSRINFFASSDRRLLITQMTNLVPNLVISCGVIDPLIWLLDLIPHPQAYNLDSGNRIFWSERLNCSTIAFRHPTRVNNPLELMLKFRELATAVSEQ